jgi:aryl-alcohol dehydrogenase-like predicted oxidoreductase
MRYRLLGHTGLRVSELCLGTMTFGEDWGWGASKAESLRMFEAFAERGGNFIDTANHYTAGTSERFLGEFLARDRQRMVLATKYTLNGRPDDPNGGGNHRKNLVQALEASLKRLATDYIDLYWVHLWDPMTPMEETLRALDDVVRAGKVLYVGISDAPAWVVARMNTLADAKNWSAFAAIQTQYSLVERTSERELLPMAKALDLAVTAWGPLGGGVLSGKFRGGVKPEGARLSQGPFAPMYVNERNLAIAEAAGGVARDLGRTPTQVALAWLRQQQDRGVVIPILGARTCAQLEDNLGCLDLVLPEEHLARLEEASGIVLGFPHDFARAMRSMVLGQAYDGVEDHRG